MPTSTLHSALQSTEQSSGFSGVDPSRAQEDLAAAQEEELRLSVSLGQTRAALVNVRLAGMKATVLLAEAFAKAWPRAHRFELAARVNDPGGTVLAWRVDVKFSTQVDGAKRRGEPTWQRLAGAQEAEAEMSQLLAPWAKEINAAVGFKRMELPRKALGRELARVLMGAEAARAWQAEREAFMLGQACKPAGVREKRKVL